MAIIFLFDNECEYGVCLTNVVLFIFYKYFSFFIFLNKHFYEMVYLGNKVISHYKNTK